jgi:hypothetical protein
VSGLKVITTAGTDITIDPVTIDANEKPWWEDPNLKK